MAQHFLLSAAARSLSAAKIMRMSDGDIVTVFLRLRWPETDGKPVCPGCGGTICYACPRSTGAPRWRCKACRGDFSVTSGTLFAHHKLPLRTYLLAIAAFCNEVKGKSMLALSRELEVQYKTALCGRPPEVNRGRRGTLAVDYAWTTDPCSMLGVAQHALISREASLCSHWHPVEKISSCRQRVSQFGWRAVSPSRPTQQGRRAEWRSRLAVGHRRRRREAVWTATSTAQPSIRPGAMETRNAVGHPVRCVLMSGL